MRFLSLALIALLAALCAPLPARATCGTMPYTFLNAPGGSVVDANTTNANNQFLLSCASSVDNTQIGPNGIFANQILPTTVAQATFGGAQQYSFLNGLGVTGTVAATNNVTAGVLMIAGSGSGAIFLGGAGNPSTVAPTLSNDQSGGLNAIVPNGATYGMRFLTWNGTTFTTLAQFAPNGNASFLGNVSGGNIITGTNGIQGGTGTSAVLLGTPTTSAIVPTLENDGANGGLNIVVPSTATNGVRFLGYNGSAFSTMGQLTPNGAASFASLTLTGSAQIGASGAITRGTTSTYPFVANEYNANEHIERGVTSAAVTPSGASYIFKTAYATAPTCTGAYNAYASGQSGLVVISNTVGAIAYGTGVGAAANVICVGS